MCYWSVIGISILTAILLNFFGKSSPLLAILVLIGLAADVAVAGSEIDGSDR